MLTLKERLMENYPLNVGQELVKRLKKFTENMNSIMNNDEESEQMKIAREVMKQDSECLRNLSKNNDDPTKNFDS
jgi:hypothetical protein